MRFGNTWGFNKKENFPPFSLISACSFFFCWRGKCLTFKQNVQFAKISKVILKEKTVLSHRLLLVVVISWSLSFIHVYIIHGTHSLSYLHPLSLLLVFSVLLDSLSSIYYIDTHTYYIDTHTYYIDTHTCVILDIYMKFTKHKGEKTYLSFCDCFNLLVSIFLQTTWFCSSSLLKKIRLCMYITFSLSVPVVGHLGWFHNLTIVNKHWCANVSVICQLVFLRYCFM